MKIYPHWTFTNIIGLSTLILGVGFSAAGLQNLGQPMMELLSLVVGISFLVMNPVGYYLYLKAGRR